MNDSSIPFSSCTNSTSCEIVISNHFTIILITNIVFGLPANSYILWHSVKQQLQNEIFFFHLALTEIIFCLGSALSMLTFQFRCFQVVKVTLFFGWFLQVTRPMFQCCVCIERYVAVVHPIIFLKYRPLKYRIACAALVWTLTLSTGIALVILFDMHLTFLGYHFLLALYMVILPLKLLSCLMVLKVLRQPGPSEGKKDRQLIEKSKIKAFRIILMVFISSLFTYLPTIVSLVLYNILDFEKFSAAWSISVYIMIIAGIVQALMFVFRSASHTFCKMVKK